MKKIFNTCPSYADLHKVMFLIFLTPFENQTLASTRPHRIYKIETGFTLKMEKEMAIHSSIPAWRIPRTEEPGRLQSMGLQRVGHD